MRTFSITDCSSFSDPIRKHILTTKKLSWAEAQKECRKKHTDLASVRNQEEYQEIEKVMVKIENYWIGLHRDSWKWSDGSSYSFSDWNTPGEPNSGMENCAALEFSSGSKWADWDCEVMCAFICYSNGKT